jgi:hypothetical protein
MQLGNGNGLIKREPHLPVMPRDPFRLAVAQISEVLELHVKRFM